MQLSQRANLRIDQAFLGRRGREGERRKGRRPDTRPFISSFSFFPSFSSHLLPLPLPRKPDIQAVNVPGIPLDPPLEIAYVLGSNSAEWQLKRIVPGMNDTGTTSLYNSP